MLKSEIETTIRWDKEEKVAHIWTNDPTTARKLDRLTVDYPDTYRLDKEDRYGRFYTAPAGRIRFSKPASEAFREQKRRNNPLARKKTADMADA